MGTAEGMISISIMAKYMNDLGHGLWFLLVSVAFGNKKGYTRPRNQQGIRKEAIVRSIPGYTMSQKAKHFMFYFMQGTSMLGGYPFLEAILYNWKSTGTLYIIITWILATGFIDYLVWGWVACNPTRNPDKGNSPGLSKKENKANNELTFGVSSVGSATFCHEYP